LPISHAESTHTGERVATKAKEKKKNLKEKKRLERELLQLCLGFFSLHAENLLSGPKVN
jgi:transcriptional regulator GlxA family with amidase domain